MRGEGAESCISGGELDRKLREVLAAERVVSAEQTVEGLVTRDAARDVFRARLRVLDSNQATVGVREIEVDDARCEALTPSLLLVLSVLVELAAKAVSNRAASAPGSDPEVAAPEEPRASLSPTVSLPIAPVAPAPAPAPRSFELETYAALALALGLNPDAGLGPSLGLRLRTPWWLALVLRGGYWPGGRTNIVSPQTRPASVEFHTFETDLALCLMWPGIEPWSLAGCWGAALVVRKSSVQGLAEGSDTLRISAGMNATLSAGYAVSELLFLALDVSLLSFPRRDRYIYQGAQGVEHEVYRQPLFAGTFGLGLGVRL